MKTIDTRINPIIKVRELSESPEFNAIKQAVDSAKIGLRDWYTFNNMTAPTATLGAVTAENPILNITLSAKEAGTYNNLKLANGSIAPAITVTAEEVAPDGVYDRTELRYNVQSNTWSKFSIEKRTLSTEPYLGAMQSIGIFGSTPAVLPNYTGYELNPLLIATKDRKLVNLKSWFAQGGTMTICLGKFGTDGRFTERTSATVSVPSSGYNAVPLPDDFIQMEGEYPVVKVPATAGLTYVSDGPHSTSHRWNVDGYNGTVVKNDLTNTLNYGFDVQDILAPETVSYSSFNEVKQQVERIKVDYTVGESTTFGAIVAQESLPGATTDYGYQMTPSAVVAKRSVLQDIKVHAAGAGSVFFAIGQIDQRNIFVEKMVVEIAGNNGGLRTQTFDEQIILEVGDRIAFKTPSPGGIYNQWSGAPEGRYMNMISGYNNVIERTVDTVNRIAYTFTALEIVGEPSVVTTPMLEAVKSEVTEVKNKPPQIYADRVSGTKYRLAISNGVPVAIPAVPTKIKVFGNSFDKHPVTSFWWGNYGMAATSRENDWVHKFLTKVQTVNPSATIDVMPISDWELSPSTYDKSLMNTFLADGDMVIIAMGENGTYYDGWADEYKELVQHIVTQRPSANIIIGGMRWVHPQKDAAKIATATALGLQYVQLSQFDTAASRSTTPDTMIMGDDGQLHRVGDATPTEMIGPVCNHYGDVGMESIAQTMFNALGI